VNARAAIAAALCAALLFGASTPLAKLLAGRVSPVMLAGLLYLGSGVGLSLIRVLRDRGFASANLSAQQWPWLLGAIVCGGVLAPILLIAGLTRLPAASVALLLNLEAVFTALLAWVVFRENAGRRVILGMMLIVAGGVTLCGVAGAAAHQALSAVLAIAAACLCWGLDNNLTRKISGGDALFIAAVKGLAAGTTNLLLALLLGAHLPSAAVIGAAMGVGLVGYGLSLVLYVLALRGLGSARTGAYFSTAPFLGAAIAIVLFESAVPAVFWLSAALMAAGVWLHLTEHHEHEHTHDALKHAHPHVHDEHHRHAHAFPWDDIEPHDTQPHTHEHEHQPVTHRHAHFPDLHHRHDH
jgi:drug/metabolite transporter (DMT)-like permease